jgi:hypothetical protein
MFKPCCHSIRDACPESYKAYEYSLVRISLSRSAETLQDTSRKSHYSDLRKKKSVMNPGKLAKIAVVFLGWGFALFAPALLMGYNIGDNQWYSNWSFYFLRIGIMMVFIGLGIVLYSSSSRRMRKNTGASGT